MFGGWGRAVFVILPRIGENFWIATEHGGKAFKRPSPSWELSPRIPSRSQPLQNSTHSTLACSSHSSRSRVLPCTRPLAESPRKLALKFNSGEKTAYHSPRSLLRSYALTSSEVWETHFQGMGKTLKSGDRDRTCLQVTRHALTVTLLWSTACVHHGKASTTRGMRDGYGVTPSCDISFICSSFLSSLYLACSQKRPTSQLLRCLFTKKKKKV